MLKYMPLPAILLFSTNAYAQDVSSCDAALAKDVLNTSSEIKSDYRLAQLIDESTYNEAKRDASGNAVLYGVPVGGSYSEYQANARELSRRSSESLSRSEARSVAWIGLSGAGAGAYKACLDRLGGSDKLTLSGVEATEAHAIVMVRWNKSRFGPNAVQLRWTASNGGNVSAFPTRLAASERPFRIQVRRPRVGQPRTLLTANAFFDGEIVDSADVVIAAYRKPPPPPQRCPVGTTVSWNDGSNGSVIEQGIPKEALGCPIQIAARADAQGFESNTGYISIIVETLGSNGWNQKCSTPRVPGSANINTTLSCSFTVDSDTQRIRIKAPNWDAEARGVSAELRF